jgi:dienelactone hydrolase
VARLGCLLLVLTLIPGCSRPQAPPKEGTGSIETTNYANSTLGFYYLIPDGVGSRCPMLICVPPLSGRGEDCVTPAFKEFAEREGFAILAPSFVFDSQNWDVKQSYQYPSAWSGEALLAMIEWLKENQGIEPEGLYLHGFSAGAQFALRFALWRPTLCVACSAHGGGGTVVPEDRVEVRFLVTIGEDDVKRLDKARAFRDAAEDLEIDTEYKEYPGGHALPPKQIEESLEFFSRCRDGA